MPSPIWLSLLCQTTFLLLLLLLPCKITWSDQISIPNKFRFLNLLGCVCFGIFYDLRVSASSHRHKYLVTLSIKAGIEENKLPSVFASAVYAADLGGWEGVHLLEHETKGWLSGLGDSKFTLRGCGPFMYSILEVALSTRKISDLTLSVFKMIKFKYLFSSWIAVLFNAESDVKGGYHT
ncbi:hypothetical protein H5410_062857 [Solanum commersonii]|uniref:Uncharacterized protein n=1 Tax=Solanum commersonii TaxID=4109 RepID=A0A9J5WBJ8_SOLCO|nr:hypothetical protein H5410_062857 [Solanum commersonii]